MRQRLPVFDEPYPPAREPDYSLPTIACALCAYAIFALHYLGPQPCGDRVLTSACAVAVAEAAGL
jgi:hypothetical protein